MRCGTAALSRARSGPPREETRTDPPQDRKANCTWRTRVAPARPVPGAQRVWHTRGLIGHNRRVSNSHVSVSWKGWRTQQSASRLSSCPSSRSTARRPGCAGPQTRLQNLFDSFTSPTDGARAPPARGRGSPPLARRALARPARAQGLSADRHRAGAGRRRYAPVVTGHSLGAGVAALLAVLLRPRHPRLACLTFACPGGTAAPALCAHMRGFVTSVVSEMDVISRLSLLSIDTLRRELAAFDWPAKVPPRPALPLLEPFAIFHSVFSIGTIHPPTAL